MVLAHLGQAYRQNPQAEVSGVELVHVLGLDAETVRACLQDLLREGLVEADLFLVNVWVRLTEEGGQLAG